MLYNNENRAFGCVLSIASHQFEEQNREGPIDVEMMVAEYKKPYTMNELLALLNMNEILVA